MKRNNIKFLTLLLVASTSLYSKGVLMGTDIKTKASLEYKLADTAYRDNNISSNIIKVDRFSNLNVLNQNANTTLALSGSMASMSFQITNNGNAKESFTLSMINVLSEDEKHDFDVMLDSVWVRHANDKSQKFTAVKMEQLLGLDIDETLLVRVTHNVPKETEIGKLSSIKLSILSESSKKSFALGQYEVVKTLNNALSIEKSVTQNSDGTEVTFLLIINIERDVTNLIFSDSIEKGMQYKEGSLVFNGESVTLENNKINIAVGDVKAGEEYTLTYSATIL